MPGKLFDRSALKIQPLGKREHNLTLSSICPLEQVPDSPFCAQMDEISQRIVRAREKGSAVVLMMGAHVIRAGVQNYLIDLMEKGFLKCLAMNGSGIIHDYEFAKIGATTESVGRYIQTGEFGLWKETGVLNDIINEAFEENPSIGLGEAVGKAIIEQNLTHSNISLLATAYRLNIPVTIHVGIGYDIIHQHPNCSGAATGALSYNDFLKFNYVLQGLEGGVVLSFGSSVMAPEIYLKALSNARNVASQNNQEIRRFSTLVCDLHDLPPNFNEEAPKNSSGYYFRPWKTMLVRTVADGGESFYIKGGHRQTIPALWTVLSQNATQPDL